MTIDFHTHIFPDKIAEKTIDFLSHKANIPAYSNGTLSGLQSALKKAEVDIAIALPVLTKPESFDSILRFVCGVNEGYFAGEHNVYSFAGIHPDCEDIEGKMARVKELGIKGVKLHPEYQQTYIDDERCVRILNAAAANDLIVVTHSGVDAGYPGSVHCTPERVVNALSKVKGKVKLVLAHYGACEMYEEVYDLLAGKDVYFDTAYVLKSIDKETFLRILEKHGEEKILFASDSPWQDIAEMKTRLGEMGLSAEAKEKILSKNALALLGDGVLR
ncbi:MAG: amidohydrolase family protein [Clostridia bacterium]|nr:amidohydrolase family protein [Clostridia bacterium]